MFGGGGGSSRSHLQMCDGNKDFLEEVVVVWRDWVSCIFMGRLCV